MSVKQNPREIHDDDDIIHIYYTFKKIVHVVMGPLVALINIQ